MISLLQRLYLVLKRCTQQPLFWLALLILAVSIGGSIYGMQMISLGIMSDEMGYMKQAVHIEDTLSFSTPGELWYASPAQLGPLFYSPFFVFFSATDAMMGVHILNASAFGLSAIPIFLIVRKVTKNANAALLAAALTSITPWIAMSGSLMLESLAYLAFCWAFWGITYFLEKMTFKALAVAIALTLIATFTRSQLVVLLPALFSGLFLLSLRVYNSKKLDFRLKPILITSISMAVALAVLLITGKAGLLVGNSYGTFFDDQSQLKETFTTAHQTFAYVIVGSGIISFPLAMSWAIDEFIHPTSKEKLALSISIFTLSSFVIFSSEKFILRYLKAPGSADRYMMYVVPLIAAGCGCFLWDKKLKLWTVASGFSLSILLLSQSKFATAYTALTSPGQAIHKVYVGRLSGLPVKVDQPLFFSIFTLASFLFFIICMKFSKRKTFRNVTASFLLLYVVLATSYTLDQMSRSLREAPRTPAFLAYLHNRNWVDQVAKKEKVGLILGMVFDEGSTVPTLWEVSFWSKQIDQVWQPAGASGYDFNFYRDFTISPKNGRLIGPGMNSRKLLVQSQIDRRFQLQGAQTVRQQNGFNLIRADQPYKANWSLKAKRDDGLIDTKTPGILRVYGTGRARNQRLRFKAEKPIELLPEKYHLPAIKVSGCVKSRVFSATKKQALVVPLRINIPAQGFCEIRITAISNQKKPNKQALLNGIQLR